MHIVFWSLFILLQLRTSKPFALHFPNGKNVCVCVCLEKKVLKQRFFKHAIDVTELPEINVLQYENRGKIQLSTCVFHFKRVLICSHFQVPIHENWKWVPCCFITPAQGGILQSARCPKLTVGPSRVMEVPPRCLPGGLFPHTELLPALS